MCVCEREREREKKREAVKERNTGEVRKISERMRAKT
jgi:hypothetical protein